MPDCDKVGSNGATDEPKPGTVAKICRESGNSGTCVPTVELMKLVLNCDSTSREPPVPGIHSCACRSPPPLILILAPGWKLTEAPFSVITPCGALVSGVANSGVLVDDDAPVQVGLLSAGLKIQLVWSTVLPNGIIMPLADTEVTLPAPSVTLSVSTGGAGSLPSTLLNTLLVLVVPRMIWPNGAWISPFWTM